MKEEMEVRDDIPVAASRPSLPYLPYLPYRSYPLASIARLTFEVQLRSAVRTHCVVAALVREEASVTSFAQA